MTAASMRYVGGHINRGSEVRDQVIDQKSLVILSSQQAESSRQKNPQITQIYDDDD
jgi:hypothetical protein